MNITVYCGSSSGNKDIYIEKAKELGKEIGLRSDRLIYGGSKTGLMGAIADAVLDNGGEVTGIVPDVPLIQSRNHPRLTEMIFTKTMAERKTLMIEKGEAFIAMPGGIGTIDEITEILSLSSLNIVKAPVVFYDVNHYYQDIKELLDKVNRKKRSVNDRFSLLFKPLLFLVQ